MRNCSQTRPVEVFYRALCLSRISTESFDPISEGNGMTERFKTYESVLGHHIVFISMDPASPFILVVELVFSLENKVFLSQVKLYHVQYLL
jgi:hypothetical protein